jgi:hypothetical protein
MILENVALRLASNCPGDPISMCPVSFLLLCFAVCTTIVILFSSTSREVDVELARPGKRGDPVYMIYVACGRHEPQTNDSSYYHH